MKQAIILGFIFFFTSNLSYSQKEIYYKDKSLKIPNNWNYKCQEIDENNVFQISCWNIDNGKTFVIQWINSIIDQNEYLDIMKESLLAQPIISESKFSNNYLSNFKGFTTYNSIFSGEFSEYRFEGEMLVFHRENSTYCLMQYGELGLSKDDFNEIRSSLEFESHNIVLGSDWNTYKIANIGVISLSDKFELRDENSQVALAVDIMNDGLSKIFEIKTATDKVVFQPKGLNKDPKEASKQYARVIINHYEGNAGDFLGKSDGFELTGDEIEELDKYFREDIEKEIAKINGKLITWYPFSIVNISGIASLKTSFLRQLGDNIPVEVNEYKIPNDNEMIVITMSYRKSEESIWKNEIEQIIKTFKPEY